jgi:WD40 repeat protein
MSKNILNPFVGLTPYSEKEREFYFGREQEVENLLQILQKNKLLTLSGDTGSGKTSLINASLIPRLKNGFVGQAGKQWSIAYFRPSTDPLSNLAHSLTANGVLNMESKPKTTDYKYYSQILKEFEAVGIVEIYKRSEIYDKKNLLIIIDQLEDLFKFKEYFEPAVAEDDHNLMDLIYRSVSYKNMPIYFLLSIESKFLTKTAAYKKLQEIISPTQYTIQNLDSSKINLILENTFYEHQVQFDPLIIDHFQEYLNEKISYLPNFQFLLYKLFDKFVIKGKEKKIIRLQDIKEFGGIENVISKDLETFYANLSPEKQNEMSLFFKALTKPQNPSITSNYEKISKICEYVNISTATLSSNIKSLKPIFFDFIEVFEQSISGIKNYDETRLNAKNILNLKYSKHLNWQRGLEWISEERDDYLKYKTFAENAIKKDNDEIDFIKTLELESAILWRNNPNHNINWAKKFNFNFTKTIEYINKSEEDSLRLKKEKEDQFERERKKEKTKRKVYLILGIGMLILTTIAYFQKREATKAKEEIEIAQNELEDKNVELEDKFNELNAKNDSLNKAKKKDSLQNVKINNQKKSLQDNVKSLTETKNNLDNTLIKLIDAVKVDSIKTEDLKKSEKKANEESKINKTTAELIELKYSFNDLKLELSKAFLENNKEKIEEIITKSIQKQKTFDSLRNRKDIKLPYISNDNIFELNKKILAVLENKPKYSQTSMSLAQSKNSIRNFNIYNKIIAFGGDKGEVQFYDIKKGKNLKTIHISQNNIEDRIRNIKFIDENSLFVTTFAKKVLKITREPLNIETIHQSNKDKIIDFFIDKRINRQYLILENEIITLNEDDKIINQNTNYKNIEASFYKDSKLYFVSDQKLYVMTSTSLDFKIITNFKVFNTYNISSIHVGNNYLFIGTDTGEVKCFDYDLNNIKYLKRPTLKTEFNNHDSRVSNLYFDEDSQILYSASLDNKIFRYDFKLNRDEIKNAVIELIGHEKWIWHMETYLNKDNKKMLLTADEDGNLLSWYTSTDDLLFKINSKFKKY